MDQPTDRVQTSVIEDEMKQAYMAYAMSVIAGRAIPDVRDGLKPVHRRILFAMQETGMRHNQPFKKSARIVGEVLGKYHPHGDSAVYDTLVRMAQDFALRYPLIDGQGNWGSIDNDPAAAMRYTESRLQKISQSLLQDLDKETVEWKDNFDGSLQEPWALPALLPNLLVNGTAGIAVGMATNMPPHNLTEVGAAIIAAVDNPELTVEDLMQYIPGPDFPTGGVICGRSGILQAYRTGRGRVKLRGVVEREDSKRGPRLIISEIPYQVYKSDLVEQIADLVRDKRVEGISDIRDESDRRGIRVVLELKRDANPDIVENQLFKYSRLQVTFGINNLAIQGQQPVQFSLPMLIRSYIEFRQEIIERRTKFDLRKAEERAHILEGLLIALNHIDKVIARIRASDDAEMARTNLMSEFELSERQAKAILDMRLQRLTALEQGSVREEHSALLVTISDLTDILERPERVRDIIKTELQQLVNDFGDERRTQITDSMDEIDIEDLIEPEDMVVTVSSQGYIKRIAADTYSAQRRGGKGIIGATTKEGDFVEHLFVANTHSYLLFFTNTGQVHWLKVYQVPESGRTAKGTAVVNLLRLPKEEQISAVIPVDEFPENEFLMFATKHGLVKKTPLAEYSRPRAGGIRAIRINEGDDLVRVLKTSGSNEILMSSSSGQAIRFSENDVRSMGRVSAGVRGMRLRSSDSVVSMVMVEPGAQLLTVTESGQGKRTDVNEYPLQGRGGLGVRDIKTGRNGPVVAARIVKDDDELLLISHKGIIIRTRASEVSVIGRNTQGVRVMRVAAGDRVSAVAKVLAEEEE